MRQELLLSPKDFNPNVIIDSGQVFRMKKITCENEERFIADSGNKHIEFYQTNKANCWNFICEADEWEFWKTYFDFDNDYQQYNRIIEASSDEFLKAALDYSGGMRILKQDLWETYISYLISQNNNIKRIQNSINKLCEKYADGQSFPTPDILAMLPASDLMKEASVGYRAEYIVDLSKKVSSGEFDIYDIFSYSYEDGFKKLQQINGIGPKVANCILLYGYHFMDSYPIDTWMKKIIKEDYAYMTKEQYLSYINGAYKGFLGYVQQLQFFYKRRKISRI